MHPNDPIEALVSLIKDFALVDLSHRLEEHIPSWPTHARFSQALYESYRFGDPACHHALTLSEHTGTHMDAPMHFVPEDEGGFGIDRIPLSRTFGRAAVIDASDIGAKGAVTRAFVEAWEQRNGPLREGDMALFRFGWAEKWKTRPDDGEFLRDWPGVGEDAAEYLARKGVSGVGTDALSVDAFGAEGFPAHRVLLGSRLFILENLNRLQELPAYCFVAAMPLNIKNGSGSPVRAVAFVPKSEEGRGTWS